jgi:hypothetical protein
VLERLGAAMFNLELDLAAGGKRAGSRVGGMRVRGPILGSGCRPARIGASAQLDSALPCRLDGLSRRRHRFAFQK